MNYLNKLRMNAGLPLDLTLEAQTKQITEARETPKRRTELANKDKKTLKQQERGIKRAMEHIKQAITTLERLPATDFRGEIPHFISELEDLLDGGEGGMEGYLSNISDEASNFGKDSSPEPEPEMDMEPEMDDEMDAADDDIDAAPMPFAADSAAGAPAYESDSDSDDFLANLSPEGKEQLKAAITMLSLLQAGPMIKETMERIAEITGKPLEEAMHYYNVNYDSFEDTKDKDRPVNVSNGSSNDEQYMDTLPATKKEAPEQTRTTDQQNNAMNTDSKSAGDDMSKSFKTPAHIKKAIKDVIADMKAEAKAEAKRNQGRAKDAEWLYNDTANAFEELLALLDAGTLYDFKLAQTKAQSLMGPMYHKIPTKVWKFLANGGEARSLKSYMTEVPKGYEKGTVKK
jgi:hypothetical protein